MKRIAFVLFLAALASCNLPATTTLTVPDTEAPVTVSVPLTVTPPQATATFAPMCTPPACRTDETYFCSGDCPNGCGTVCATVTPDPALAPLTTVLGTGEWILRSEENAVYVDPSGAQPGFALQRIYAPLVDFFLVREGQIYTLTDIGDGSLILSQVYPRERSLGSLDLRRNIVEGSLRGAPIFSADGASLVWSRPEAADSPTRVLYLTSLETGESREVWRTDLPEVGQSHGLVPLFYDAARSLLVYALHEFYSGMTPTQVASLYVADTSTGAITPLWPLNPMGMYAGVSAAIAPNGQTLAYLTWGEPQADFTLPWTLHLRDLTSGNEIVQALPETWENVEVHLFAADGQRLLLSAGRHTSDGSDFRNDLQVFDLRAKTWTSLYTADEAHPFFDPRAWTVGDWLVLSNGTDYSTWVMRPDGTSLIKVTPLEWVGLLQP